MRRPCLSLSAYTTVVSAVGGLLLAAVAALGARELLDGADARLGAVVGACIVAELLPIRVPRRPPDEQLTAAPAFAVAALLSDGLLAGMVALVLASLAVDLFRHPRRASFNAGQYVLSLAAAGLVAPGGPSSAAGLPLAALALLLFFAVNTALVTTAAALASGTSVAARLREGLAAHAPFALGALALAPVIVSANESSPVLLVALLAPVLTAHRAGKLLLANEHQALHDALTHLPNRTLLSDRIEQALSVARREGGSVGVLLFDLDHFKEVNDTFGHHYGDLLLRQVAPRVTAVLRASDTVARLSGDEFAVLLPSLPDPGAATEVGEKILRAFERPFATEGVKLEVGVSIGIAVAPEHGEEASTLLQHADAAMYQAKEVSSGYEIFRPNQATEGRERASLLGDLRRAMDDGELTVAFMPKVELTTGTVFGAEALVRWRHPQRGIVMPGAFVGHAESTGLIKPLTMYVLDRALRQCDAWRRSGLELRVAVNLSVRNLLDRQLPGDVVRLLEKWSLPPELLELEITEATIMADPLRARGVLERLSKMGIGLAIDDFGTGYSSLGYLRRLPVAEIKIDRSFVTTMASDEHDVSVVRSAIDVGRNLGLRVVAEGIESEAVRDRLAALGCQLGQGYLFSPPLEGDELLAWAVARARPLRTRTA